MSNAETETDSSSTDPTETSVPTDRIDALADEQIDKGIATPEEIRERIRSDSDTDSDG